jgi:hypothetical protein
VQKVRFIYADLQRTHNRENEILLNTNGTKEDLKRYGIELEGGKDYWFWRDDKEDDPLIFSGKVKLDGETKTGLQKSILHQLKTFPNLLLRILIQ